MSVDSSTLAALRGIERDAATWVVREERGLTATEQAEFSRWLAADSVHRAAFADRLWAWREFDRISGLHTVALTAPDPDLLAPQDGLNGRFPRWLQWSTFGLAAAAALAVLFWSANRLPFSDLARPSLAPFSTALAAPCEQRTLDDGTVVTLNRGARFTVSFTPELRRVTLERGEAHFVVAKNPARPFVVAAAGVTMRAVGTAFNVRLDSTAVEIVVTEGRVQLGQHTAAASVIAPPMLGAGQRAIVALSRPAAPAIVTLSEDDLAARLGWQPRLLDFTDAPLSAIVEEFNRRNPVQLTLASPALATLRLNASFNSDNVAGFVRLLVASFGLDAEWRSETEIALLVRR